MPADKSLSFFSNKLLSYFSYSYLDIILILVATAFTYAEFEMGLQTFSIDWIESDEQAWEKSQRNLLRNDIYYCQ